MPQRNATRNIKNPVKLTLLHKGLLLVSIPLCFEIGVFSYLISAQDHLEFEAQRINRNKKINDQVNLILQNTILIIESVRAKGNRSAGAFLPKQVFGYITDAKKRFAELEQLAQDAPDMLVRIKQGETEMHHTITEMFSLKSKLLAANADEFPKIIHGARTSVEHHIQALTQCGLFEWASQNSVNSQLLSKQISEQIRLVLKCALVLSVLIGVVSSYILSKRLVGRLARLSENARRLGQDKPLLPVQGGGDEIAELDRNFHQAADLLTSAKRTRQEVTAMITHDLRTPLQTVLSYLEMLEQGVFGQLNESGNRLLSIVQKASNHMTGLIENVLQLEKLRSGAVRLETSRTELAPFLSKCAESVKLLADEKNQKIKLNCEDASAEYVDADPFWLEQVIVNLLSNGIKFSPADSTVSITASKSDYGVTIRISDQGPGIPDEEQKLIFDRFHRMQSTASVAGTGLGLPIAKELIELHGGTISVQSVHGNEMATYSTFTLQLPASKRESPMIPSKQLLKLERAVDQPPIKTRGNFTLLHKGLFLICVPLFFEITLFGSLMILQDQVEQEARRIDHNRMVNDAANAILRDLVKLGFAMEHRKESPALAGRISELLLAIKQNFHTMEKLVADEPNITQRVRNGERAVDFMAENSIYNARKRPPGENERIREEMNAGLFEGMRHLENRSRSADYDLRSNELRVRTRQLLKVAVCLSVLFAWIGAMLYSRHIVVRLSRLGENARRLASGEPLLAPVQGTDEVASLDATFHSAAAQIEAAKRMRQEATAMITHDLKTPLQSVRSFLEMLANGKFGEVNERGIKLLSASQRSSQHMVDLINSVLQLEKLRTGHLQLQTAPLELSPLLDKCLDSIKLLADAKQISLTRDYGELKSVLVDGEAFWLEQVFVNVLSNAIKFSPEKSTVSLKLQKSGESLEVLIADQGVGIAPEDLKLIFERFHRVQSTALTPGSGLGLPIAKELIELHHGSLKADSVVGEGSTFSIRLPLADSGAGSVASGS